MAHFETTWSDERVLDPRDVLGGGEFAGLDEKVSSLMGALSSPTRIRALFALVEFGEMSAGGLAEEIRMSRSATSHQLRLLRNLGLVARRREGRSCIYALADEHLEVLLREALYHVDHVRLGLKEGERGER